MRQATEPFQIVTASYLVRIGRERAGTLGELAHGLRACSDASIFYHTFQSLESHHYAAFSSDFAQWVLAACNEAALAERLAALDFREYVSLDELREALTSRVEDHLRAFPPSANRPAFEPFYFCEAIEVSVPGNEVANNLAELSGRIQEMSLHTLHHHFINSRLRLRLQTNDFSHWIHQSLGLQELAISINRIDIHMNTLEDIRREVLRKIEPWINL